MYREAGRAHWLGVGLVVIGATALAVALPTAAMPLYLAAYPDLNAKTFDEALIPADLDAGFSAAEVIQFETLEFHATLIYDTVVDDPELFTIQVAQSNAATLTAEAADAFTITPTSPSVMFLNSGTARPEGGFALTWTWDVTPLLAGEQNLNVTITPEAFVNGVRQELKDLNAPYTVTVQISPAQQDFQEVVSAARDMEVTVPENMTVGEKYDVSASFSLAGHGDAVSTDIDLTRGEDSVPLTIIESEAVATAGTATGADDVVIRRWIVTPNTAGQVSLVFTARLDGAAGAEPLHGAVDRTMAARAEDPPVPIWEVIRGPVTVIGAIIGVISGAIALWATLRKRSQRKEAGEGEAEGDAADRPQAVRAKDAGP